MKQLLTLSILAMLALGCKTQKNAETGKLADPSLAKLNVSFISIGSGINHDALKAYDKFIADYEKNHGVDLQFEVIHWGREGETDYCFKLAELKEKKQADFIAETQKVLKGKEHVIVSENFRCRENRF
jgi:hypothetical protein